MREGKYGGKWFPGKEYYRNRIKSKKDKRWNNFKKIDIDR